MSTQKVAKTGKYWKKMAEEFSCDEFCQIYYLYYASISTEKQSTVEEYYEVLTKTDWFSN